MRAQRLLKTRGAMTVFSARLAGPISKFMPFLAGSLHMPLFSFLLASVTGIIAGTAQFIFAGWFLGKGIGSRHFFYAFFSAHPILIGSAFFACAVLVILLIIRWRKKRAA